MPTLVAAPHEPFHSPPQPRVDRFQYSVRFDSPLLCPPVSSISTASGRTFFSARACAIGMISSFTECRMITGALTLGST